MNFATKAYNITHLTLGMLMHYFEKLKIRISAHIQQIWKKMQINCILRNNHLRNSPVNLFAVYSFKYKLLVKILSLSPNTMLIVDTNTAVTYAVTNFRCNKVIAKVKEQ